MLLAGCNTNVTGSYPVELKYPARTDPIIVDKPTDEQFYADQPGTMEQLVLRFGPPEQGGIGGKIFKPGDAPQDKRDQLNSELSKLFGTPAEPTVKVDDALAKKIKEELNEDSLKQSLGIEAYNKDVTEELQLATDTLRAGSQLYRRHCLTCHGLSGDGRGPTGPWVNPHPRDYRQGAFKFLSTDSGKLDDLRRKPHRADLMRTLVTGVDGTTMPSFALLPEAELNQLISYVIHLSIRGEVEAAVLKSLAPGAPETNDDDKVLKEVDEIARFNYRFILENWAKSNLDETVAKPPPYHPDLPESDPARYAPSSEKERRESVRNGYKLFTNSTPEEDPKPFKGVGACLRCHQDFGRQANFLFDQWGTLARPANLTLAVYRGGRRPIDLYWRLYSGIGAHMPASKLYKKDAEGQDTEELDGKQYWDLINFVLALPYPEMLPSDVRTKVYPSSGKLPGESQHASR
jgi:mono/diheme cytochrome c family protein